jgi:sulfite reductase subunit B
MQTCKCEVKLKNDYIPYPAKIQSVKEETYDTKTFKVKFSDKKTVDSFDYKQGQFMQISLLGVGEVPISVTSSPSRKGFLEFTIRATGSVTNEIHKLKKGDAMYLRGPYGNEFPFEELKGKNIYFVAGGIGLAPVRSLINLMMDNRKDFGHVKILYGARTPADMCFTGELEQWKKVSDTEVLLTVDEPRGGWDGNVGVVTELWKETEVKPDNAVAVVCGPPVMIKFAGMKLAESGFAKKDIYVTLERYMKCGIGKCGHCNVGEKFICIDGPVFNLEEVEKFPAKENVF